MCPTRACVPFCFCSRGEESERESVRSLSPNPLCAPLPSPHVCGGVPCPLAATVACTLPRSGSICPLSFRSPRGKIGVFCFVFLPFFFSPGLKNSVQSVVRSCGRSVSPTGWNHFPPAARPFCPPPSPVFFFLDPRPSLPSKFSRLKENAGAPLRRAHPACEKMRGVETFSPVS